MGSPGREKVVGGGCGSCHPLAAVTVVRQGDRFPVSLFVKSREEKGGSSHNLSESGSSPGLSCRVAPCSQPGVQPAWAGAEQAWHGEGYES